MTKMDMYFHNNLSSSDYYSKNYLVLFSDKIRYTMTECFYNIISFISNLAGETEQGRKYEILSTLNSRKARIFDQYMKFGDNLINPAINIENGNTILEKPNDDLFAEIQAEAGISFTESNRNEIFDELSLNKTNGVCLAFALEFISEYIDRSKDGSLQPIEILKDLSAKFKCGASQKTSLLNRIQGDILFKSNVNEFKSINNSLQDGQMETKVISSREERRVAVIGNFYGLTVKEIARKEIAAKSESNEDPREIQLQSTLDEIHQDGVYLVGLDREDVSHAVAYIKHADGNFLFDPNFGTLRIPQGMDAHYLKNCFTNSNKHTVMFNKCNKSPKKSEN